MSPYYIWTKRAIRISVQGLYNNNHKSSKQDLGVFSGRSHRSSHHPLQPEAMEPSRSPFQKKTPHPLPLHHDPSSPSPSQPHHPHDKKPLHHLKLKLIPQLQHPHPHNHNHNHNPNKTMPRLYEPVSRTAHICSIPIHPSDRTKERAGFWIYGGDREREKGEGGKIQTEWAELDWARLDFALICVLVFICVWKGEGESPCNMHERRRGEDALHKR